MPLELGHPVLRRGLPGRPVLIALYLKTLLSEFRGTLVLLTVLIALAALLHNVTPAQRLGGSALSVGDSVFAGWMALLAQPQCAIAPWYLKIIYCVYPILGFILIGEGVVRLALLMVSRRQGEKEWMQVVASTYRDHVILCGLGHLGSRVLEQLVASHTPVVVLERAANNPFLAEAKAMHVPVLIRDMKEDQALIDAGVERATAVIICTNNEITNLEVGIDSRRMNPNIRVVMRMYEQQVARKISEALMIDAAFSSSTLAAPVVAAMALKCQVLSTICIANENYVAAEVTIGAQSVLDGQSLLEVERSSQARVLALTPANAPTQSPPENSAAFCAGDVVVVHIAATGLSKFAAAARPGSATSPRTANLLR